MKEKIQNQKKMNIGLACYKRNQWQQLLATADDSEEIESTWEEWRGNANDFIDKMKKNGMQITEVLIDVDEISEYCHIHKLSNNAKTRAEYITRLLQRSE